MTHTAMDPQTQPGPQHSLWLLVRYFLRLGTLGFGGPVALVGYMYRDLVEARRWISEADYKEGLALAQLAPGPLAAQLAIYVGFVHYGIYGATLVGLAFVLPSFVMVVILGWTYRLYGGLTWMQAVFYGVGSSVIGIIAFSAYKLTTKSIGKDRLLWAIYLTAAIVTVITESESVLLFIAAGLVVWLVKTRPKISMRGITPAFLLPLGFATPTAAGATSGTLWPIFKFFAYAGSFVFGSGLAIVPFLYGGVVNDHQWLSVQQFLDAVAVAMITPGPVVITTGFIGYLIAGFPGATMAALATFLPCYLLTIIPAPYFKKYGKHPGIAAAVEGVTTAAIGAIAGAVLILGRRSILIPLTSPLHDPIPAALALVTLLILYKTKRIPEPVIVLGAATLGLIIYPLLHG